MCVVSRECYDCTRAKQQQGCLPLKKFLRNERRNSGTDARQRNKSFITSYSVTCMEDAKQNYKISIFSAGLWLIVELDISYMQMRYITHMFPTIWTYMNIYELYELLWKMNFKQRIVISAQDRRYTNHKQRFR